MISIRYFVIVVASVLAFAAQSNAKTNVTLAEKTALQVAMQQHVDRQLVNGSYLHLDFGAGEVKALFPVTAHPMVLQMGDYFVLCSDFRDKKGGAVNVDFYIARRGKAFVVFHTEVDNRKPLERLMAAGKVERVE